MPMTLPQFSQRVRAGLKEDLSAAQTKAVSAAHGIYAREVAQIQSQLQEEIAELRVSVERGHTAVAEERTRTAIAALWNRENLVRFGRWWVKPISEYGKAPPLGQTIEVPRIEELPSEPLGHAPVLSDKDESNVEEPARRTQPEPDPTPDRGPSAHEPNSIDWKHLESSLAWYLRVPVAMFSKVFGEMTPLAAAILIVIVIAGSIAYGVHARSLWKSNFEAQQEINGTLTADIERKSQEIGRLKEIEFSYQQLVVESKGLLENLKDARRNGKELNQQIVELKTAHAEERQEREQEFRSELQKFETDAVAGFQERLNSQAEQVGALRTEKIRLEGRLATLESDLKEERLNRESTSAAEQSLRGQNDELREQNAEYYKEIVDVELQSRKTRNLVVKMKKAIEAVDLVFWSPDGLLEIRRACYRDFYRKTMASEHDEAIRHNVPLDMRSDSYDLDSDPNQRLRTCDRDFWRRFVDITRSGPERQQRLYRN